jgi:hypothetical protein
MITDEYLAAIKARIESATPADLINGPIAPAAEFVIHAYSDIPALLAEIDRLKAQQEWQPIETAPKDAIEVLVYSPSLGPVLCKYSACDEASRDRGYPSSWVTTWSGDRLARDPTYWLPLPAAPELWPSTLPQRIKAPGHGH